MSITQFIQRTDAFCLTSGKSRVWLSKHLFGHFRKLDDLASGKADIGVRRMEQAGDDLAKLEAEAGMPVYETAPPDRVAAE